MTDPRVKNRSLNALFDHISLEISPAERQSELFEKIRGIADQYHFKRANEYKTNVNENRFVFGKFKGKKIESVYGTEKGRDYCQWLMNQLWFEEKFVDNHCVVCELITASCE